MVFEAVWKACSTAGLFRVLAKEWLNILFGETLVGIAFLLWWSLAGPSNAKLIIVFVAAIFVAGYYAWRADHLRLMPRLELKNFTRASECASRFVPFTGRLRTIHTEVVPGNGPKVADDRAITLAIAARNVLHLASSFCASLSNPTNAALGPEDTATCAEYGIETH